MYLIQGDGSQVEDQADLIPQIHTSPREPEAVQDCGEGRMGRGRWDIWGQGVVNLRQLRVGTYARL
jgi:hypothetical protein